MEEPLGGCVCLDRVKARSFWKVNVISGVPHSNIQEGHSGGLFRAKHGYGTSPRNGRYACIFMRFVESRNGLSMVLVDIEGILHEEFTA
jgi:hypothetical protein